MLGPGAARAPTPQNTPEASPLPAMNYAKPVSHFPNPIGPYTPRHVAAPNLANTARIDQLMHDGKLYLSLNDAIALALENNLDIAIARYNLNIADTDVLRAKAGAADSGRAPRHRAEHSGRWLGRPRIAGRLRHRRHYARRGRRRRRRGRYCSSTSGGSLGRSSRASIRSLPARCRGPFQHHSPPVLLALATLSEHTPNFAYQQGFSGAQTYGRIQQHPRHDNSSFQTLSPQLNSGFQFKLTQHLLRASASPPNTRFIRIAKNNRELSDVAFRLQIITTVDQIENMYWDLVYAYENLRVKQESLTFSQKTLSDTKKQVEIGSLAPIEGACPEHGR